MLQEMVWPKNPCRLRMYWHLSVLVFPKESVTKFIQFLQHQVPTTVLWVLGMRDPEPPKSKASRVCFSQERFLQLFAVSFMAASGPVINKAAHPLPLHLHGKESLFVIEDSTDLLGGFKAQNPPSMARMIEPPVICIPGGSPTIHGGSTSSDMLIRLWVMLPGKI